MINKLVELSLRNRAVVIALTVFIIAAGVFVLRDMPIDAFPDLSENQVLVYADWMGRGPQEVQDQVTYPLESALRGLPKVKEIRSQSGFGMSLITVVFEDGVDPFFARQVVNEKAQQALPSLPQGVVPALGPVSTPMGQVFMYTLESDRHDLAELRSVQDFFVKQQLGAVSGVAEVASIGGHVLQYQINLNPDLLRAYNLGAGQVYSAIAGSNANVGASVVEQNGQEYVIRGLGLVQSLADLEKIVIVQNSNVAVTVGDIARVEAGPEARRGVLTKSGYEAAGGIVVQQANENTLQVIERVKEKIDQIGPSLPDGMKIVPFYDQTGLVNRAVATLTEALLEEFSVVFIVVLLFMGNFRSSIIVTSAIPIGILIAFIFMRGIGLSANLMSLGGIAIGIGVMTDAAIVMVENIYRHLAADQGRRNRVAVALAASKEVAGPLFFSLSVVIVTFFPVFALTGTEGKLYNPMAWTKTFALTGSLLLAITLIPVLCTLLLRGRIKSEQTWIVRQLNRIYLPVLQTAIRHRKLTIAMALVLLLVSFSLVPFIGTEFMPTLEEGSILVMPTMLPSVSLTEATEAAKQMERLIMAVPEVAMSVGKVGRAQSAMDPAPISMIETIVTLKPKAEWRSGYTQTDIERDLMVKLADLPGLNLAFTQPIAGRLAMLTTGIRTELGVKIYGDDIRVLQQKALEIESVLAGVPGVSDLLAERILGAPYLEMTIDRDRIARYGLTVSDVEEAIELAIGGRAATTTIEGKRRVDVLVRFQRDNRETVAAMQRIPVPLSGGGSLAAAGGMGGMGVTAAAPAAAAGPRAYVPLGEVAQFHVADGPSMISSENGMYRALVQLNTRDRDIGGVVAEASRLINAQVEFPPGFYYKWSGQYENQERAKDRLAIVIPAVILLTFMLLFMSFSSATGAAMLLLNVPFSLVGGIASVFLTGTNFNVAVAVGFIALFGIAVQDGVMMLDRITELAKERPLRDAVIDGAMDRFRPVIMTCTVAGAGLLPLLLASGAGAEVQRPMALVIVGGLVSSTFLTLILLPCIYYAWHSRKERMSQKPGMREAVDHGGD
ncbi:MAG: CusA/CzcA family heavy metal efflux RND transporter [Sporomusaceae bacterium]|nr:CusA/CzcA family heavy metal efflux RND transporter [Sporomusaceae bacterium]